MPTPPISFRDARLHAMLLDRAGTAMRDGQVAKRDLNRYYDLLDAATPVLEADEARAVGRAAATGRGDGARADGVEAALAALPERCGPPDLARRAAMRDIVERLRLHERPASDEALRAVGLLPDEDRMREAVRALIVAVALGEIPDGPEAAAARAAFVRANGEGEPGALIEAYRHAMAHRAGR